MRAPLLMALFCAVAIGLPAPGANAQMMQRKLPPATPAPAPDPASPPADPASPPADPATPPGTVPPGSTPETAPRDVGTGRAVMPRTDKGAATRMGGANVLSMMTGWERLPGCAKRISIAALTQIYVTGCGDASDTPIFHWNKDHWDPIGRSGVSVAGASNVAQGPDAAAGVFSGPFPITTVEIAGGGFQERSSGGGWLWGIAAPQGDHWGGIVFRTHCFSRSDQSECQWQPFGDIYMKRIGAGVTDAVAWAVGEDGKIYRQVNQGVAWTEKPGCATTIANGGKEQVWVIGCDEPDAEGNRGIYRWKAGTFVRVPGLAKEIAVQSDGKPWVLTGDGGVWRLR
ncbi:MAG: hypothetical protein ABI769_09015 [Pseudomonadota bacterium]